MATEVSNHLDRIEDGKNSLITSIEKKGVTVPIGTKIDVLSPYVDAIETASSVKLQSDKSVIPSKTKTTVKPDSDYAGLKQVTVEAIPDTYIIPKGTKTITSSGTHDVKEYANATVGAGTAKIETTTIYADPVLSDNYDETNSGYKISVLKTQAVTPTVTEGYISSGTEGTILVRGSAYVPQSTIGSATTSTTATATRTIGYRQQTTVSAGYYSKDRIIRNSVAAGSATVDNATISATQSITVDTTGLITAKASGSKSIAPTVSEGYVSSGIGGIISVSGTGTQQLPTQSAKTITPTTEEQVAVASGRYTTGEVKVAAVPTETKTVTSSTSKQTLTPTSGNFFSQVIVNAIPTETQEVFPYEYEQTVTPSSGSVLTSVKVGAVSSTYVGSEITRKGATTITPKASKQTAVSSGTYVTGDIEVAAISLQSKDNVIPSKTATTVKPDTGYVGLSQVTVAAIPDTYIQPSGTITITSSGTHDVKEYANAKVGAGSATTPATTITANPSLSTTYTSGSGYKMSVSATESVTPTVSAGYVSSGTKGTITVSGSAYVPQSSTGSATTSTTATAARTIGYGQQTTIGAGYYHADRIIRNSVSSVTRASTSITTTADDTNDVLTITASNSQGTGYVVADSSKNTATKKVTLSVGTPTIDSTGKITVTASATDNSSTAQKVSKTVTKQLTNRTQSDVTVNGTTVTIPAGYYNAQIVTTVANVGANTQKCTINFDVDYYGDIEVYYSYNGEFKTTIAPASTVTPIEVDCWTNIRLTHLDGESPWFYNSFTGRWQGVTLSNGYSGNGGATDTPDVPGTYTWTFDHE